jgi:hypothetical protein
MRFPLSRFFAALLCIAAFEPAHAGMRDAAPARGEPFDGLYDRARLVVLKPVPRDDIHDKRLAVLLTDASRKHLMWSNDFAGGEKTVPPIDRLHKELFASDAVMSAVVDPLARKALSVSVVKSLDEFKSGTFDWLVLMDVTFVNIFSEGWLGNKHESGTYIGAHLVDRSNALLNSIEVGQARPVQPERFLLNAADIRKETFERYRQELDKWLGPDKPGTPAK